MSDYLTNEIIAIIEQLRRVEAERDEAITQRNRWHRLVQIAQQLNRKLEGERDAALRERGYYKEALQKSITSLGEKIEELKGNDDAGS